MVYTHALTAAAAASLLLAQPALSQGLYTKSSPVIQVDGKSYDNLIAKSNHTSIVEFYAPWCGHCKNLQPAYEKAAKSLAGLAKVAAVNCDDEANKPFCGSMGVQGFPTLKIVRPGKKAGRPNVEDYQGARSAKAIVDAVKDKIPNHVKRVTDKSHQEWLEENAGVPKAILFSDKGATSALIKALAIDYLGGVSIAQVRDKEKAVSEEYGISKYPTFILLPLGSTVPIVYDGEMKKDALSEFVSQVATPNPDPAPKKSKPKPSSSSGSTDKKKSAKASSSFSSASESHASADSASSRATQTSETIDPATDPTASPDPNVVDPDAQKPIKIPAVAPSIPSLATAEELQQSCLTPKSPTCILFFLPTDAGIETAENDLSGLSGSGSGAGQEALTALSEIHHKHTQRGGKIFPFFAVPESNPASNKLRSALGIDAQGMAIVATSAKKKWVKKLPASEELGRREIEDWIDEIRMGEGKKEELAASLIVDVSGTTATAAASATEEAKESVKESAAADPDVGGVKIEEIEALTDEQVEELLAQARANGKVPEHGEL